LGLYLFRTKSCIVLFAYCKKKQPTCQHFTLFGGKSKKASLWSCFSVEHAPAVNLGSKGSLVISGQESKMREPLLAGYHVMPSNTK